MKPQGHIPEAAPLSAHEGADLDVPLITRIAALLAGILVLLVLSTMLIFYFYENQYPHRTSEAAPIVTVTELPPAPRLQAAPRLDLQNVRAQEEAHLEGYAWVDRTKRIVRIPIERAMARWVELQNAAAANLPGGATPFNPLLVAPVGNKPSASRPVDAVVPLSAPASTGVTELQMRQQKAQEGTHAP